MFCLLFPMYSFYVSYVFSSSQLKLSCSLSSIWSPLLYFVRPPIFLFDFSLSVSSVFLISFLIYLHISCSFSTPCSPLSYCELKLMNKCFFFNSRGKFSCRGLSKKNILSILCLTLPGNIVLNISKNPALILTNKKTSKMLLICPLDDIHLNF